MKGEGMVPALAIPPHGSEAGAQIGCEERRPHLPYPARTVRRNPRT